MRLKVVKDKSGKAVASYEHEQSGSPSLQPQVGTGHTVEDLEVPDDYAAKLHLIYQKRPAGGGKKK